MPVEYRDASGRVRTVLVKLIDFDDPDEQRLAGGQPVHDHRAARTAGPMSLVFVNGIPLALLELKNLANEHATLKGAWNQIQTYRNDIPAIFTPNAVTVISDGISAAMSSFTGGFEHYAPWKTIDGREVVTGMPCARGARQGRVRARRGSSTSCKNFVVFSDEPTRAWSSASRSITSTGPSTLPSSRPSRQPGPMAIGAVAWSGTPRARASRIEMLLYAAKIMRDPRMSNPTLVFLTDRNDLDDQLFGEVFAPAEILPEKPVQADSRADLRALLRRVSGGIIFTTLQKFAPEQGGDANPVLTDRRNVVVVADEAHRSQYGFTETLAADGTLRSGLAKHMRDALPGATYLGFTGTPIESTDKSTRAVFGDYIDVYDLTRAVEDGATVKIFYESRLAKVELSIEDYDALDDLADEITEQVEDDAAQKAKIALGST